MRKVQWVSNDTIVKSTLSQEVSFLLQLDIVLTLNGREISLDEYPAWASQIMGHFKMVLYRVLVDLMVYGISLIGLVGTQKNGLGFKNLPLLAFSIRVKPNLSFEKLTNAQCEYEFQALHSTTIDSSRLTVVEHPLYGPNLFGELQSPVFSLVSPFNTYKALQKAEFHKKQLSSSVHIVFERDHYQQPSDAPAEDNTQECNWNKVLLARQHDVRLISKPHETIPGIVHHIAPMDTSFKQIEIPKLTDKKYRKEPCSVSAEEAWRQKVELALQGALDACNLQLLENLSSELLIPFNQEKDRQWGICFKEPLPTFEGPPQKRRKKT